jgi:hypothetical protein
MPQLWREPGLFLIEDNAQDGPGKMHSPACAFLAGRKNIEHPTPNNQHRTPKLMPSWGQLDVGCWMPFEGRDEVFCRSTTRSDFHIMPLVLVH